MKRNAGYLVVTLAVMIGVPTAFGYGLTDLGTAGLPSLDSNIGTDMATYLVDVSKDGTLVSGTSSSGNGWIWTPGSGQVTMGTGYRLVGVDWLGSSVLAVGNSSANYPSYWTGNASGVGTWTTLPAANGSGNWKATALGVAADNSDWWAAGYNNVTVSPYQSILRYQNSTASATSIQIASGGHNRSFFYAASNEGTFAGVEQYGGTAPTGGAKNGIYWKNVPPGGNASTWLPTPAGLSTSYSGVAGTISGDGNTIGGIDKSDPNIWYGLWWNRNTPNSPTRLPLVLISGSTFTDWMVVHSLNNDGNIMGGLYYRTDQGDATWEAFIYFYNGNTVMKLSDYFAANGIDTTGWTFRDVTGMSDDGKTLVGWGVYGGVDHDWVVVIPEPGTLSLLAIGGLVILALRRFRAQRDNA